MIIIIFFLSFELFLRTHHGKKCTRCMAASHTPTSLRMFWKRNSAKCSDGCSHLECAAKFALKQEHQQRHFRCRRHNTPVWMAITTSMWTSRQQPSIILPLRFFSLDKGRLLCPNVPSNPASKRATIFQRVWDIKCNTQKVIFQYLTASYLTKGASFYSFVILLSAISKAHIVLQRNI